MLSCKSHHDVSEGEEDLDDKNCSREVWPYGFDNVYGNTGNANILSLGKITQNYGFFDDDLA